MWNHTEQLKVALFLRHQGFQLHEIVGVPLKFWKMKRICCGSPNSNIQIICTVLVDDNKSLNRYCTQDVYQVIYVVYLGSMLCVRNWCQSTNGQVTLLFSNDLRKNSLYLAMKCHKNNYYEVSFCGPSRDVMLRDWKVYLLWKLFPPENSMIGKFHLSQNFDSWCLYILDIYFSVLLVVTVK